MPIPYDNNPNDINDTEIMPYDDAFDPDEFVAELMAEGYSEEEARRMAGEYDPDEYYGLDAADNEITRDIPDMDEFDTNDFVDEEDAD